MFRDSDRDFMSNKMKIIVDSIESKLNEPFFIEFKEVAISAISKYIDAINRLEELGPHRSLKFGIDNQAEEFIRAHFCEITTGIENTDAFQVLDALRHSFSCYAYNGLHQLYTRQENECWHPKILLTEVLEPNDIDSLPERLTLYRGCDIAELEKQSFGQSWSTSLDSAKKFAYTLYRDQDWFDENGRVVLTTSFFRGNVLFSDQSVEYEVVVDIGKLGVVRRHA